MVEFKAFYRYRLLFLIYYYLSIFFRRKQRSRGGVKFAPILVNLWASWNPSTIHPHTQNPKKDHKILLPRCLGHVEGMRNYDNIDCIRQGCRWMLYTFCHISLPSHLLHHHPTTSSSSSYALYSFFFSSSSFFPCSSQFRKEDKRCDKVRLPVAKVSQRRLSQCECMLSLSGAARRGEALDNGRGWSFFLLE